MLSKAVAPCHLLKICVFTFVAKRCRKSSLFLHLFDSGCYHQSIVEIILQFVRLSVSISLETTLTRHRASTSMYSLTFCVRVMLPQRHHCKPAVQATAVMLRTPTVDGQPATATCDIRRAMLRMPPSPASH